MSHFWLVLLVAGYPAIFARCASVGMSDIVHLSTCAFLAVMHEGLFDACFWFIFPQICNVDFFDNLAVLRRIH